MERWKFGRSQKMTLDSAPWISHYRFVRVITRNDETRVSVNEAVDARTGASVVVKVYEAALLNDQHRDARRFRREVQIISSLQHPHILSPIDFGEELDKLYFVMHYMPGGTLSEHLRQGPLALDEVSQILQQLVRALTYAHELGIIHRDLKPSNIFFDAKGTIQLADFGLAKNVDLGTNRITKTGALLGTPAYMSPEQWLGDPLDRRTDIYSLGVVLFEMLAGRLPFQDPDPFTLMNMHLYAPPPLITDFRPELPLSLGRVLDQALSKAPGRRVATADLFWQRYEDALNNKPQLRLVAKPHAFPEVINQEVPTKEFLPPSRTDTTLKLDQGVPLSATTAPENAYGALLWVGLGGVLVALLALVMLLLLSMD
ncbi:MAG: serine/threonine protein kinase [Anaerolineae bacterium]|nr:serine/threonine protein kinase [Anaerolineae bacterium]